VPGEPASAFQLREQDGHRIGRPERGLLRPPGHLQPPQCRGEAFQFGDIGYGNAIAVIMLVLGAVFSVGYVVSLRRSGGRA
jgi:hypothetical protein